MPSESLSRLETGISSFRCGDLSSLALSHFRLESATRSCEPFFGVGYPLADIHYWSLNVDSSLCSETLSLQITARFSGFGTGRKNRWRPWQGICFSGFSASSPSSRCSGFLCTRYCYMLMELCVNTSPNFYVVLVVVGFSVCLRLFL